MAAVHMTVSHHMSHSDPRNSACQGKFARRKNTSAPAAWTTVTVSKARMPPLPLVTGRSVEHNFPRLLGHNDDVAAGDSTIAFRAPPRFTISSRRLIWSRSYSWACVFTLAPRASRFFFISLANQRRLSTRSSCWTSAAPAVRNSSVRLRTCSSATVNPLPHSASCSSASRSATGFWGFCR